jgi:hypothetical protein
MSTKTRRKERCLLFPVSPSEYEAVENFLKSIRRPKIITQAQLKEAGDLRFQALLAFKKATEKVIEIENAIKQGIPVEKGEISYEIDGLFWKEVSDAG